MASVKAGPGYDPARQHATIDYSFYLDPRFRADPRRFYPRPAAPPEPKIEEFAENDVPELQKHDSGVKIFTSPAK